MNNINETKDCVVIHSLQTLLENYRGSVMYSKTHKVPLGQHMISFYKNLIEDINDIETIEIQRISARKWQVCFIMTSDNSYNVEDDGIFLSPANFKLKTLTEQIEIYQYSSFFGIHINSVSLWELERFPEKFKVFDENDKEFTQSELKDIAQIRKKVQR